MVDTPSSLTVRGADELPSPLEKPRVSVIGSIETKQMQSQVWSISFYLFIPYIIMKQNTSAQYTTTLK